MCPCIVVLDDWHSSFSLSPTIGTAVRVRKRVRGISRLDKEEQTVDYFIVVAKGKDGILKCEDASGQCIEVRASETRWKAISVGDVVRRAKKEVALVLNGTTVELPSTASSMRDARTIKRAAAARARAEGKRQDAHRHSGTGSSAPCCRRKMSDIQKLWEL